MNHIYKFLFISVLLISSTSACKKQEQGGDPNYDKKIEEAREYLKAHIKDRYEISETSDTRDQAILNYLNSVSKGEPNKFLCSKEEYIDVFLPNTLEEGTLTTNMPLEQAWEITNLRRTVALEKLQNELKGAPKGKIQVQTLTWRDDVRILNSLKGHRVGTLIIKVGTKSISLEQIRLVIEHKGKFKLCVIGA
ncbi:hypothetical protein [Leptospira neocaledonica]|uniref:Uncharacterized protein n=1 Tax=Leptospira neocaledonica TaxID=2023192 RepID=A0A2M9ZXZ1_9LEPT|nr:hypothetical protein [Leptospira neocaledonica]PJZ76861.1 hypothetical protein CH365_12670 [Leptospira neocaledonica]